ncbi:hypothetical protein [Mucilaginibacter antarcticus]|uniref:DUF2335 domain-containing protein n=1 Tax=Mucilaginibacter antarcticus TaxID=1855725 RepID=A0ABW5XV95_9SPHI
MTQEFDTWKLAAIGRIKVKTSLFTDPEIEKHKLNYPERLLEVIPRFLVTPEDFAEFQLHTDALIAAMPETNDIFKANINTYFALVEESRAIYTKRYNLVKKGAIAAQWLAICLAIGTGLGIVFKKVGLGIPFGLIIGIMIGQRKEKEAAEQGRIL